MYRTVLRILGTLAFALYILFLIGEKIMFQYGMPFVELSVYLLFIVFAIGYFLLWKNEFYAGICWMVWYIFEWLLGIFVWPDPDMVLIMGFPVFVLGIMLLCYGLGKRRKKS